MNKCIIFLTCSLIALPAFGRQRVPDRDIAVNTGTVYQVLTTEDTLDEVIVTFDAAIKVNETNSTANTSNITINAVGIDTNSAEIVIVSNRVTVLEGQTNTLNDVVTEVDLIGNNYIMSLSLVDSGTADSFHTITNYDSTDVLTDGLDLVAGTFTPPRNGKYLLGGHANFYNFSEAGVGQSNNYWFRVNKTGWSYMLAYSSSVLEWTGGTHKVVTASTNDVFFLSWMHQDQDLGTSSNYLSTITFEAIYLGN
jgi:hypothetical protein